MSSTEVRQTMEWIACAIAAAVAVLTVSLPTWIETVFGADPDAGSGAVERTVVISAFGAAVAFGLLARWDQRRSVTARA